MDEAAEAALISIVRELGREEVVPRFRRLATGEVRQKTSVDDLVTEVDLAVERAIRDRVREILPDAAFVGEEATAAGAPVLEALEAETCVVVDPVDGTWNYANGVSVFGTMLAVVRDGRTVFGLLYDPLMDDWLLARRGGGAWMCRPDTAPVRLCTAPERPIEDLAGHVPLFLFSLEERQAVARPLLSMRRVTSLRCACHEYRLLAQGRIDFVLGAKIKVWDHAAGVLAVTEAGGAARLFDGRDYAPALTGGRLIAASGTAVADALAGRLGAALAAE